MSERNVTERFANLYEALKTAPVDTVVGIRLVPLTGTKEYALFGAEIAAKKRVGAHYHTSGHETYQIIEGEGIMLLGELLDEGVHWHEPFSVTSGDCFTVDEKQVHQLINTGSKPLLVVFGCPKSHLSEDRIVVDGFEGEL